MSKTVYERNNVDENGELTSKTWLTSTKVTTEAFIKVYLKDIAVLCRCSGAEISTALACCDYVTLDTNELVLNAQRRKEIVEITELRPSTVNIAISKLYKKDIFIRKDNKTYLNPLLFFKGDEIKKGSILALIKKYEII